VEVLGQEVAECLPFCSPLCSFDHSLHSYDCCSYEKGVASVAEAVAAVENKAFAVVDDKVADTNRFVVVASGFYALLVVVDGFHWCYIVGLG